MASQKQLPHALKVVVFKSYLEAIASPFPARPGSCEHSQRATQAFTVFFTILLFYAPMSHILTPQLLSWANGYSQMRQHKRKVVEGKSWGL